MRDQKRAGDLADAHLIRNRLRKGYDYGAKRRVRERAIKYLARFNPTLVLDFWSGGMSADAMTAAGLAVLSVDNFSQSKLRKDRAARAIAICGEEGGYEGRYGDAVAYAERADAGFLDGHGHLSKPMLATLDACRHMKAVVVTALAARAPVGTGIGEGYWELLYREALKGALGMTVDWSVPYRSPNGQLLITVGLRSTGTARGNCRCGCGRPVAGRSDKVYFNSQCQSAARQRRFRANPANAEHIRAQQLRYYYEHRERQMATSKRWKVENQARNRAYRRAHYLANLEDQRAKARERMRRLREGQIAPTLPHAA